MGPQILSVGHTVVAAGQIQLNVEYDFPNGYCQTWETPDTWPVPGVHNTLLEVVDRVQSRAVFEHGQWKPTLACTPGMTLTINITRGCGSPPSATRTYTVDSCSTPERGPNFCPSTGGGTGGGAGAGLPINVGSGDVTTTLPLFTIQQAPLSLSFDLTYHSSPSSYPAITLPEPLGRGWTHPFNQILVPIPGTNRLYHYTADGREHEYTQNGAVWTASRPAELRGTVSATTGPAEYRLTDLDGTVTAFDQDTGRWKRTQDRWGNRILGGYDGSGRLSTITDSADRTLTLVYTGSAIDSISIPEATASRVWSFWYDSGRTLLLGINDPLRSGGSHWRSFGYDGSFRLISVTDDASKTLEGHTYWPDGRGKESYSEGGARNHVLVEYDLPLAGQRRVTHRIDGGASLSQVSVFSLVYQGGRWLPVEIDGPCSTCGGASGDTQVFTYTNDNHVETVTDGAGTRTDFTYNADGNVFTMTESANTSVPRTTTWGYTYPSWPNFWTSLVVPSTNSGSKSTTRALTGANETTLTVTEFGYSSGSQRQYTTTSTFDGKHRLQTVDGPRTAPDVSDITTYEYYVDTPGANDSGRLHVVTDAAGLQTTYSAYDVYGTPLTTTDPNSAVTQLVTDARGRVTHRSLLPASGDPDQSTYTTIYDYDSRDRLDLVTLPAGNKIAYVYEDGTNRLLQTIREDSAGNQKERLLVTLNDIGGKTREEAQECTAPSPTTNCSANWTTRRREDYDYDAKNRLWHVTHAQPPGPDRITYGYNANGLLESVQDERHTAPNTTYLYDSFRRLWTVTQRQPLTDGPVLVTTYEYDAQHNLRKVTDPKLNETIYTWDDFHRLTSEASPVSGGATSTYDEAGNLVDRTDANGALTHRAYDAANRLLTASSSRSGSPTELVTNTWGDATAPRYGKGRLRSAEVQVGGAPMVTTTYGYERRGLVASEAQDVAGTSGGTAFSYDANGNRTGVTYPSGRLVTYSFDFADRPSSASSTTPTSRTYVSTAAYYPFGPEKTLVYGNGTTRSMTYDQRYGPATLALSGVSPAVSYSYGTDPLGNITSITDGTTPAYSRIFGYDDLNRLTSATTGTGATPQLWGSTGSFTYNDIGSRTTMALGTRSVAYDYQTVAGHETARLLSVTEGSTTAVTLDTAGNETSFGAVTSSYSPRNFLGSTGTTNYLYDARGVRVSEFTPAGGSSLYTVAPCRVFDTRLAPDPYGGPALAASQSRAFTAWNRCGIGTDAIAIAFNVTGIAPSVAAYFTLFPSDVGQPATSTLNLRAGRVLSNNGIVKLSSTGQLSVFNGASQGVDALLDVTGYFVTNQATSKLFTYSPELNLLSETNTSTTTPTPHTEYVWFGRRPVAQETVSDAAALRYTVTDHLGTPFLQTDSAGTIVWRAEYEPFGKIYAYRVGAAADQLLRLPGQEERPTAPGRFYNVFRWYRPDLGQYTQPDPIRPVLPEMPNEPYLYGRGNPPSSSDPTGLFTIDPTFPAGCRSALDGAITIVRDAFARRPGCNRCSAIGTPMSDIFESPNLLIGYVGRSVKGPCAYGDTPFGLDRRRQFSSTWNPRITGFACRMGRWMIARAIIHEITHVGGASFETPAYSSESRCGFPELLPSQYGCPSISAGP